MEENIQYYETYEENLQREILRMCTSLGMLDGELLSSEDIDQKWKEWAPEYIAEALPEVNTYPEFAIACAGYAGMAVAQWWDQDWGGHHSAKYESCMVHADSTTWMNSSSRTSSVSLSTLLMQNR